MDRALHALFVATVTLGRPMVRLIVSRLRWPAAPWATFIHNRCCSSHAFWPINASIRPLSFSRSVAIGTIVLPATRPVPVGPLEPISPQQQRDIRVALYRLRHYQITVNVGEWMGAIRQLVQVGRPAVPELVAELDRTSDDATLRALGFTLRAIGDPRACPALIRALARTAPRGSDYGTGFDSFSKIAPNHKSLGPFMWAHSLNRALTRDISYDRAILEIAGALETITLHQEGRPAFIDANSNSPTELAAARERHKALSQQWQRWWDAHHGKFVSDQELASLTAHPHDVETVEQLGRAVLGPPFPTGAPYHLGPAHEVVLRGGLPCGSAASMIDFDAERVLSELDACRLVPPRTADAAGSLWTDFYSSGGAGIDASGIHMLFGKSHRDAFCLQSTGTRSWQVADARWDTLDDEIQSGGDIVADATAHSDFMYRDPDTHRPQWLHFPTTFLFRTREGGAGIVQLLGSDEASQSTRFRYPMVQPHPKQFIARPLAPLAAAPPFGPIVEVTLPTPGAAEAAHASCMIDLDTGKTYPAPAGYREDRPIDWGVGGADFMTMHWSKSDKPAGLRGHEMVLVPLLPDDFDTISPALAMLVVSRHGSQYESAAIGSKDASARHTFLFKTHRRRGRLDPAYRHAPFPPQVRFRYKLIPPRARAVCPAHADWRLKGECPDCPPAGAVGMMLPCYGEGKLRMKTLSLWVLGTLLSGALVSPALATAAAAARKPNVLFILADDLGYGDLGTLYQNDRAAQGKPAFATPHLDALAGGGMILRQHYTGAPVCAPARASLMTGLSQGHCPVRDNQFDKPIPQGLTLASMLKQAGYRTGAIGKWGIGGKPRSGYPAHPMRRGFDKFFGFMLHNTGHVYYHDAKHPLMDGFTDVGGKYENVYSTDLFTARAKQFISAHHADHPDQPFFLYLAYTAVHNALQVPGGAYPGGAGAHGGLHWPLEPTPDTRDTWIHPDYADKPWTGPMKRYATMVRRLDDGVGDVLQLLEDLGIADNTLIVFTSDNGPANEGGADPRLFDSWGPFDGFKRDCWEGGVREPTFAAWPGHIAPRQVDDLPSGFWDWMPTLAEVAGLPPPAHSDGVSLLPTLLHQGSQRSRGYIYVEYAVKSKNPASADVFARKHVSGRGQQQLVRIGSFVGIRTQIESPADPLRLYDVLRDPHEDHDLATDPSHALLLQQMKDLLVTARRPDPDAPRPYDDMPLPALRSETPAAPGLKMSRFDGDWPWTPDFDALDAAVPATSTATIALPADLPDHPFGLRFDGYLKIPVDGEYTFTTSSDAGIHLWLHDAHLIDSDGASSDHPLTATVRLAAGIHPLRVFYRHHKGRPQLMVHYRGPGIDDQAIPPAALSAAQTK
jgi:arylsulfatase A-like enzyme